MLRGHSERAKRLSKTNAQASRCHFPIQTRLSILQEACVFQPQRTVTSTTRFKFGNERDSQPLSASFRSCDVDSSVKSQISSWHTTFQGVDDCLVTTQSMHESKQSAICICVSLPETVGIVIDVPETSRSGACCPQNGYRESPLPCV